MLMAVQSAVLRILNLSHWVCDYDGQPLKFPYLKMSMWRQYPFFHPRWLWQVLFGDNRVLRFHNEECFRQFVSGGKLIEIQDQKTRQ